jgi:hypothetical protein
MVLASSSSATPALVPPKTDYKTLVKLTAKEMRTFDPLNKFLNDSKHKAEASKIDLIRFDKDGKLKHQNNLQFGTLKTELAKEDSHQLLLVENITRDVVIFLGENWGIPPDCFLSHLENSNWYSLQNISQNLPSLRSGHQSYVRFQFIGPREFEINHSVVTHSHGSVFVFERQLIRVTDFQAGSIPCDSKLPDRIVGNTDATVKDSATIGRIAGGFNPIEPPPEEGDESPEEVIGKPHSVDVHSSAIRNLLKPVRHNLSPPTQGRNRVVASRSPSQDPGNTQRQNQQHQESSSRKKARPVGFVRNSVTIWFDKFHQGGRDENGWTKGLCSGSPFFLYC